MAAGQLTGGHYCCIVDSAASAIPSVQVYTRWSLLTQSLVKGLVGAVPEAAVVAKSVEGGYSRQTKPMEDVGLADTAIGQVYVCSKEPLGAHLKPEVQQKIWKDKYIEIFFFTSTKV